MKKALFTLIAATVGYAVQAAPVQILESGGWFESGYVTWEPYSGATDYAVYVCESSSADNWVKLDDELVRKYPNYYRADALGLKAGDYQFKVEPIVSGDAIAADAAISTFTAAAHNRSGFAHVSNVGGVGAYNNDGTLKDGAEVLYVWADNAKTITHSMVTDSKGAKPLTGLQGIIKAYEKGLHTKPLAIRIIGTIKAVDMDYFGSSAEGLQVKGKEGGLPANLTIEGVGNDATIHGLGILCRSVNSVEIRNFAIMLCMDDCLSIDTDNHHVWIHNMDFFYGNTGGDADQAKGDGTVDIKGKSSHVTVSYNHFYDAGKCSLGGMKSETTDCWMSYHHNWFDHSDSRHPRIRTAFYHIYNNYFDGNSKYGVGVTMGGSAMVERNYFRNCKYPLLSSKQGTDAEGDGTFSGEAGGVIKAFDNVIVNPRKIQYNTGAMTNGKWDAVLVASREAEVNAIAFSGGTPYNNVADYAARTSYVENVMDAVADIPGIVCGNLGAGRMQHGDFTWAFSNAAQDENDGVINALKSAIIAYSSTLVGFASGSLISNGGAASPVNAGDGKNISPELNDAFVPSWGSGKTYTDGVLTSGSETGGNNEPVLEGFIGSTSDYFWFNADNMEAAQALIDNHTIVLSDEAMLNVEARAESTKDGVSTSYSDHVGSLQLPKASGYATFYCEDGINQISFFLARTGSMSGDVQYSNDGQTFAVAESYSGSKGTKELTFAFDGCKYVRITNKATGTLHIQGLKIFKAAGGGSAIQQVRDDESAQSLVYDLMGQRQPTTSSHGIRIVGGKKVILR